MPLSLSGPLNDATNRLGKDHRLLEVLQDHEEQEECELTESAVEVVGCKH